MNVNIAFFICTDFTAGSVAMLITLIMAAGHAIYALNHVDPVTSVLAFCKMRYYVIQSSSMMYRWSLTAACFDRYALSSPNVRLRNIARVYIARRVVAVIVSVWIVLPVHILIFHTIRAGVCGPLYSIATALYHSIFTTITGCILPISLMVIFTLLIHRNLVLKQKRRQLTLGQRREEGNELANFHRTRDQQVVVMLFAQVFVYTVGTTPLMIWLFYNAVTLNIPNKSVDRLAIERLIGVMIELLVNSFPVLSFYLYIMTSRTFRGETVRLSRFALRCGRLNNTTRIKPIANGIALKKIAGHQVALYPDRKMLGYLNEAGEQRENIGQNATE
jgi:hypothetical protein